jgi:hypothetical protein
MKRKYTPFLFAVIALIISVLACGGSISTANVNKAWMATDEDGKNPTTVFSQDAIFYAMVDLKNAPDDTTLKAVWTAVDAEDTEPNLLLTESEITSGDALVHFQLENADYLWPIGQYKVDIYLNDKLDQTLTFEVR